MKFESAPIALGSVSIDGGEAILYAVAAAVLFMVIFSMRREIAVFAVLAGVIGLMLAQ